MSSIWTCSGDWADSGDIGSEDWKTTGTSPGGNFWFGESALYAGRSEMRHTIVIDIRTLVSITASAIVVVVDEEVRILRCALFARRKCCSCSLVLAYAVSVLLAIIVE